MSTLARGPRLIGTPEQVTQELFKMNREGSLAGFEHVAEYANGEVEVKTSQWVELIPPTPSYHPAVVPAPVTPMPWYQGVKGAAVATLTTGGLAAAALIALIETLRG